MPPVSTPLYYVVAVYICLLVCERVFSLRQQTTSLKKRLTINLAFFAFAFLISGAVLGPAIIFGISKHSFSGLMKTIDFPFWFEAFLALLILDLTSYYWHRLNHIVPLLWRFHNIHHCDPDMDTTTSLRFHPVEIFYSAAFRYAQVVILGLNLETYIFLESILLSFHIFHHSNVKIPLRIERFLNLFLVTPRMHEVHHSQKKEENFSNYGVIFSFWDRAHRSFSAFRTFREVQIGVPAYSHPNDNKIVSLLLNPFLRQRNYWDN